MLENTNWLLILSLVFGSAALAVAGDSIGTKYGKKRISLFGLRPRHTSRLITAITGSLIASGTLGVMSVFSQDVRTALFGMKILQQQMNELQFQLNQSEANAEHTRISFAEASASLDIVGFELDTMKNDKLILEQEKRDLEILLRVMRDESEQLKKDLKTMRSESIALNANILLGQSAFEPGMSRDEIISGLNTLKQQVRLNALAKISDQSFSRLRDIPVIFNADEEEELIRELESADIRQYVRALSGENAALDDNMRITVRLETGTSTVIYHDGEPVYRKFFADMSKHKAEEMLHYFLRELRNKALNDGIIPEPATSNVGTLDGEAFFSAVETLNAITEPVIITALASGDIYTEGPVVISIIFEE
ncbi:MAG: DUF3084 domain-containing protein [Synergistaceae bacterium]|nr:DUF3084 domain-containing protein [Synergistaceae bacterium]MBR0250733.1 DUF3084 domain-containing protein [Synergistaceae bacterium]